jgi:enoyl-CoA hydratase/carnithine racemase
MMPFTFLKYDERGPIAVITLNRPEVLNALNVELYTELRWALVEAQSDPEIQLAIITGAGRAFCVGADLKTVADHHASEHSRWRGAYDYADAADALFRQIAGMSKIVITMVNGLAYAGGIVLACCSDIAVASDDATFCVPEGRIGIADELSTVWLQASVGLARAKLLILTGEPISAAEAHAMGLIAKVVSRAQLWEATEAIAGNVLKTGPRSRAVFKQLMNERVPIPRPRHIVESHLHPESKEGAEAFSSKRRPNWVP